MIIPNTYTSFLTLLLSHRPPNRKDVLEKKAEMLATVSQQPASQNALGFTKISRAKRLIFRLAGACMDAAFKQFCGRHDVVADDLASGSKPGEHVEDLCFKKTQWCRDNQTSRSKLCGKSTRERQFSHNPNPLVPIISGTPHVWPVPLPRLRLDVHRLGVLGRLSERNALVLPRLAQHRSNWTSSICV